MKYIALFLLALASNAFAIGFGNDTPGGITTNVNTANAYAGAHADAYARAQAQQTQMQPQVSGLPDSPDEPIIRAN